jgi:hypothetical protein
MGRAAGKDKTLDRKWMTQMTTACGFAPLPPSYLEYLRRFRGAGTWRLIKPAKGWPSEFNVTGNRAPQRIREDRELLSSTYATHAPRLAATAAKLVPFASDAAMSYFCWNPGEKNARGEPAIYAADYNFGSDGKLRIKRLGSDLLEVLRRYQLGSDPSQGVDD